MFPVPIVHVDRVISIGSLPSQIWLAIHPAVIEVARLGEVRSGNEWLMYGAAPKAHSLHGKVSLLSRRARLSQTSVLFSQK